MQPLLDRVPAWLLLLFAGAFLWAGITGLADGAVRLPNHGLQSSLLRSETAGPFWLLVTAYLIAGAWLFAVGVQRIFRPADLSGADHQRPVTAARPRWALRVTRGLWIAMLAIGLVSLACAVAFWSAGPEMTVLTAIFGGLGLYVVLEAVGHLFFEHRG